MRAVHPASAASRAGRVAPAPDHPANPALVPGTVPASPDAGFSHCHVKDLGKKGIFSRQDVAEVRFFGKSSAHDRVVHFRTNDPQARSIAFDGDSAKNGPASWNRRTRDLQTEPGWQALDRHSASLPGETQV